MTPIIIATHRDTLPTAERTLLWSMRAWVVGLCRPQARVRDGIEAAFAGLGAPAAAGYLDGFMWALRHGALRTIGVDCPCNPHLDPNERALLDVFACCQGGDSLEAVLRLRGLVNPRAAWVLLDSAGRVGTALGRAGHELARSGCTLTESFALSGRCAKASDTVH